MKVEDQILAKEMGKELFEQITEEEMQSFARAFHIPENEYIERLGHEKEIVIGAIMLTLIERAMKRNSK